MSSEKQLSRREREIMDIVYAQGQATAASIREAMHEAPGPATVRKLVQILENKGHLTHAKTGREHVYRPMKPKRSAARRAMQGLLDTFFGGSLRAAIASHLTGADARLPDEELKQIAQVIREAQKQTRNTSEKS